jgi:hypothetical protein
MDRHEFLMLAADLPAAVQTVAIAGPERPTDYLPDLVREGIAPGAALGASRGGSVKLKKVIFTCCRVDRCEARLTLDTRHPLYWRGRFAASRCPCVRYTSTHSPKSTEKTSLLRNKVTDLVFAALG